jgi:hypothetical protein
VRQVCTRLLLGVDESGLQAARPEELAEVEAAKRSTALELTHSRAREEQKRRSRWFGAKWAEALATKLVRPYTTCSHPSCPATPHSLSWTQGKTLDSLTAPGNAQTGSGPGEAVSQAFIMHGGVGVVKRSCTTFS